MPPSPNLRRSPSMEPRADSHKRGRSFESGLSFKGREKDDDLALFNEMQSKDTDDFLLQPTEDFEDIFSSKARPFPDLRLGINIPARGESSDLLNSEGDKNDYDWLLTPPDTPLFPSLDDEPAPVNLLHNGRARSRPVSISKSSTVDRSQRSSRGSPCPQRSSPSPRSGSSTLRGRPSSAPNLSPIPLRPSTPSRRPSPPPAKPSTPPPRTSTPPPRSTNTGSGASVVTPGLRGTSPVRTSRGNSASPKIRAWQANIPGFSLEAPPNLRTTLADRPASYVRGSSPASRTSRESPSKFGRQSMSPTASRSISSSHSQERDRLSSHSKGSLASSGDDDADSLQSIPVSVSDRPISRKGVGSHSNSRPSAFSKKPTKTFSPSSAPKRSFDSAMRQMDRRSPQNMFRPLLSSVPSATLYAGRSSAAQHAMVSRNSSVTTSSNASSDQATSGAHDAELGDQYEDDMTSKYSRAPFYDIQDEVFTFDKMDAGRENSGHEAHDELSEVQPGEPDKGGAFVSDHCDPEESDFHVSSVENVGTSEAADMLGDFAGIDNREISLVCSRCGCRYIPDELSENEEDSICPQCKANEMIFARQDTSVSLTSSFEEANVSEPMLAVVKNTSPAGLHEENKLEAQSHDNHPGSNCSESFPPVLSGEAFVQRAEGHRVAYSPSHAVSVSPELNRSIDKLDQNTHVSEGAGISVLLLNRSSSIKGPLVHSRTFNSSAVSYDDLSYARDLTSSMRSSVGHGSVSTSSSIDLASSRHGDMHVQRQLSGKRSDTSSKPQSTVSSLSGTSMQVYQGFGHSTSSREENQEGSVGNMRDIDEKEALKSPSHALLARDNAEIDNELPVAGTSLSEDAHIDAFSASIVGCSRTTDFENSQASLDEEKGHVLLEINEDIQNSIASVPNAEELAFLGSSLTEEITLPDDTVDPMDVAEDSLQCTLPTVSEIEIDGSHPSSPRSPHDVVSREELEDCSPAMHPDIDVKDSSLEVSVSECADGVAEESTVTVEDQGGRRTRSLTLEEATDTILFCSSIIHDLAYKAASIAIEKEKENLEPLEGSRPTVTIPDRRNSNHNFAHGNSTSKTIKTPKARKRRTETEAKPSPTKIEERSDKAVVRNVGLPNNGDSLKPPKLESKCNCTIM